MTYPVAIRPYAARRGRPLLTGQQRVCFGIRNEQFLWHKRCRAVPDLNIGGQRSKVSTAYRNEEVYHMGRTGPGSRRSTRCRISAEDMPWLLSRTSRYGRGDLDMNLAFVQQRTAPTVRVLGRPGAHNGTQWKLAIPVVVYWA